MSKKVIQVEVSEHAHQLGEAVKGLVGSVQSALADGFQAGQDLPKIASENFAGLVGAVQAAGQLGFEAGEDMNAFMKAWALVGADIAALFVKKPAA